MKLRCRMDSSSPPRYTGLMAWYRCTLSRRLANREWKLDTETNKTERKKRITTKNNLKDKFFVPATSLRKSQRAASVVLGP